MATAKEHQVQFSTLIDKKTRAKLSRAVQKYGSELKKATGAQIKPTFGMVLDMLLDRYIKDEDMKS